MRSQWVESFRRCVDGGYERIGGGCERIGGGFGLYARGVADVRAHEYTRVIPDTACEFHDP